MVIITVLSVIIAIIATFVAWVFAKKFSIQQILLSAEKDMSDAYRNLFEESLERDKDYANKINEIAGYNREMYECFVKENNKVKELAKIIENYENNDQSVSEYEIFSYRTILRSIYIQLASNPTLFLTAQNIIAMIETSLSKIDPVWLEEIFIAYEEAQNGDTTSLSNVIMDTANDLALIQPPRKGELIN